MSVQALGTYAFPPRDRQENFGGNIVTYWHWEKHLVICSAVAFPLPPDMPFAAVVQDVLPGVFGAHPDFEKVDWDKAEWTRDGEPFVPDFAASLADNGIGHKSLITFATPGLDGIAGSGS